MDKPTPDQLDGMDWWNTLAADERAHWMRQAGDTGRVFDAWATFKQAELQQLGDALQAERRETPPDDLRNWIAAFNDETQRPYWLPRNLSNQWHRLRLAAALRLKMRRVHLWSNNLAKSSGR
jgi:hypothetical protein